MSFILEKGTSLDFSFLDSLNFNFYFGLLLLLCVIVLIIAGFNDKGVMISFGLFLVGTFIILITFSILLFNAKEKECYIIKGNNGYKSYSVNISKEEYEALKSKQSFKKPELTVGEVESVLGDVNKLFTEETKEGD